MISYLVKISDLPSRFRVSTHTAQLLETLLFSFLIFFLYNSILKNCVLNIFGARDYFRTEDLLSGHFIWYGPDLSRQGFSTGPFLYWLLAPAVFAAGVTGYLGAMVFSYSAGLGLAWHQLKKISGRRTAFVVVLLFATASVSMRNFYSAWNPSFVLFFWSSLAFQLAKLTDPEKFSDRQWLYFCLLIGLSAQIHISSFYWFFVAAIFLPRLSRKRYLTGVLAVVLPQIPFLIWYATSAPSNPAKLVQNPPFLLSALDAISNLFSPKMAALLSPSAYVNFVVSFGPATVLTFLAALILGFTRLKKSFSVSEKKIQIKFLVLILVSFILSSRALETGFSPHYRIPILLMMLGYIAWISRDQTARTAIFSMAVLAFALQLARDPLAHAFAHKKIIISVTLLAFYLIFYRTRARALGLILLLIFFLALYFHRTRDSLSIRKTVPLSTAQKIAEHIYQKSGWTLGDFRKHTLQVQPWVENTIELAYVRATQSDQPVQSLEGLAGFMYIKQNVYEATSHVSDSTGAPQWKKWLSDGTLTPLQEVLIDDYRVIAYRYSDRLVHPFNIQNIGEQYKTASYDVTKAYASLPYYDIPIFEDLKVSMRVFYDHPSKKLILYSAFTSRLASAGPQVFLKKPQLRFLCGNTEETLEIPDLGYDIAQYFVSVRDESPLLQYAGNSILTPIEFQNFDCATFRPLSLSAQSARFDIWNESGLFPTKKISEPFMWSAE